MFFFISFEHFLHNRVVIYFARCIHLHNLILAIFTEYICVCVSVCGCVCVWKGLTVYFFFVIESSLVTSGMKVTSSESLRSHPADAAVDGNVRTCYYSNRNPPKWWKLDMSRTLDILAVSIILPTSGKWNGIFLPLSSSLLPLPSLLCKTFFKLTLRFFSLTQWTCVPWFICLCFHFISFHGHFRSYLCVRLAIPKGTLFVLVRSS